MSVLLGGDTLYLRGGTYIGPFTATVHGSPSAPVTIRPYPGERVIIDGGITINGSDTIWRDIEFLDSSWTTRTSAQSGSQPSDIPLRSVSINAPRTKFINCSVHDISGFGFWAGAIDSEVYGCLVYNIGWEGPDRGHGHAIYTQNQSGTKRITNNFFMRTFSNYSVHAYTEGGSIQGYDFSGNTHDADRWLVGGYTPVSRISMHNNYIYGGNVEFGYVHDGGDNVDVSVTNNIFACPVSVKFFTDVTATGNTFEPGTSTLVITDPTAAHTYTLSNTFNATGSSRAVVLPNAYDTERAGIIIYNYASASSVSLDLSTLTGLISGHDYELLNAQNPSESYQFTYSAGVPVSVPMTGYTVAVPLGHDVPIADSTFPQFGAFLLRRV